MTARRGSRSIGVRKDLRFGAALAFVLVTVTSGCASGQGGSVMGTDQSTPPGVATPDTSASDTPAPDASASEAPSPPMSSTPPPTLVRPSEPPSSPSDAVGSVWVTGTVTRGGSGPCYGMITDTGRELALYTTAGPELAEDAEVRVRVSVASFSIDCGPGELWRLLEVGA